MKRFKALKNRIKTREIMVGEIGIGKNNPIRVQTMTNTDTLDIKATAQQIWKCVQAGAELVRITTPTPKHAKALQAIRQYLKKQYHCKVPLIADVHFLPSAALEALKWADKVRLNPGNFLDKKLENIEIKTSKEYQKILKRIEKELQGFIQQAKKFKKPIRIGTNHGSLSKRILNKYGNTTRGMVEGTMEYLRIFQKYHYNQIVVALKASDPLIMIEANRKLVFQMKKEGMDYPIHLGVTEAGSGEAGRAKSVLGIGTLLLEGIGDTLRVSLTESPEKEIPVAYDILQATRRRITQAEFISCPGCGRTLFDIEKVSEKIKTKFSYLKGVTIAVMGCIVNGPGEMAGADFGYVGSAPGKIDLYYKEKLVKKNIPQEKALKVLEELIQERLKN